MSQHRPEILFARCLGACAGVRNALKMFQEQAARMPAGQPLYVLHELVHNQCVSEEMKRRGARFVSSYREMPEGCVALIGAHGATREEEAFLRSHTRLLLDATCPVVRQLQEMAAGLSAGVELVFYGRAEHQEVRSVLSYSSAGRTFAVPSPEAMEKLPPLSQPVLLCQTSLDYQEAARTAECFRARYPHARCLGKPCQASLERQKAVEELVPHCDALLVIGSSHSANARRLQAIGRQAGIPAWLANAPQELPPGWDSFRRIGVTAAASTPEGLIRRMREALEK